MADRYVRSTNGADGDGSTWALAEWTLSNAAAIDTAGDTIYVSQSHAETTAGALTHAWAGTVASPTRIICGNDTAEPPVSPPATTATVATTGASNITITGHCYQYGINYIVGDSTGSPVLLMATANNDVQLYERCSFYVRASGSSARISVSGSGNFLPKIHWKDCDVKFAATGHIINLTQVNFIWEGGSLLSGGVSPTALFSSASATRGAMAVMSGLDLSNGGAGMHLFSGSGYNAIIRNCKLPASWSGQLYNGVMSSGGRIEMHNCDSADTNYRIWVKEYTAELISEITIVKSSGASDGTTALSWKIVTTANCNFASGRFQSPEIFKRVDTVGSPVTVTVEIVHDSLTALTDDEVWLEVQYFGTSGSPLGSFTGDSKADVLATAANQASSSATWTTTGLTNPNTQKLEVTFTPQEKGYIHARVCMGKASYTIYVDPKVAGV